MGHPVEMQREPRVGHRSIPRFILRLGSLCLLMASHRLMYFPIYIPTKTFQGHGSYSIRSKGGFSVDTHLEERVYISTLGVVDNCAQ